MKQENKPQFGSGKFVNIRLNVEELKTYDEWVKTNAPDCAETLQFFCDDSYKVSFSTGNNGEGYRCTVTQEDRKHRNANLIMSSYGDSPEDALLLSLYKVEVLFQGQRLPEEGQRGHRG